MAFKLEKRRGEELKEFGRLLSEMRGKHNISVSSMARRLGADRGTLERWEEGTPTRDDPPKRYGLALSYAAVTGEDASKWFSFTHDAGAAVEFVTREDHEADLSEVNEVLLAVQAELESFRKLLGRDEPGAEDAPN